MLRRQVARAAKLARLLVHADYRRALADGVAAAVEHERLDLPEDVATVLDVGANRGQFALVAARRWPQARIVCFEPLPAARRRLGAVAARLPRATVRDVALAESGGEVEMHLARADDSSSLLPISARQSQLFPGTDEVGLLRVRAARLDTEVGPDDLVGPVLLKIDVQGGELGVLRGAVGVLGVVDVVLVECSFVELYAGQPLAHEIVAFLAEHGLVLAGAGMPTTDGRGRVVQQDLVFRRPS
jgi:FkbM family methyltransferase